LIGNGVAKSKRQAYIAAEMRTPVLLVLAALTVASGACGTRRGGGKPLVGVTLPSDTSAFYVDLRRGMQQAADSLGLNLQFGGRRGAGADTVLEFNADLPTENREGGRLLGAYVARRLGGGGNVVILQQPAVNGTPDRVAGFRQALKDFPNIRILASPAVEGRVVAKQRMENLLATGQKIDAVFGSDDECALGALAALQTAGTKGTIVVGYGGTTEARAVITQGTALVADAVPDPVAIGRRAIEAVAARLRGEAGPPAVPAPVALFERDSLRP
jgi:ABC-type sugar transport system substrate-binding protein